jgi:hypothetical protein
MATPRDIAKRDHGHSHSHSHSPKVRAAEAKKARHGTSTRRRRASMTAAAPAWRPARTAPVRRRRRDAGHLASSPRSCRCPGAATARRAATSHPRGRDSTNDSPADAAAARASPGSSSRDSASTSRFTPATSSWSSRPNEYNTFVFDDFATGSHSLWASCR